ncbi:MAG: MaoC/PaaZ C-terminal domain-containing protein [Myxococcota bacterium]
MPLSCESVGVSGELLSSSVDARWTMAYAAGLGDARAAYLDTRARPDVLAHPLFPVCFEWPAFLSTRHLRVGEDLSYDERVRGVHASHDLVLHRPLRAGVELETRATIARVERRPSGAFQVVRLDTHERGFAPVSTTWYGSLFRGVEVSGADRALGDEPPAPARLAPDAKPSVEVEIPVAATAAHVYTECARIWNPIHSDTAVAARAGLPGIILHGTATLAHAVTAVVDRALGGDPERVARIACRFTAMVRLPSVLRVRIFAPEADGSVPFDVLNAEGEPALRGGLIVPRS